MRSNNAIFYYGMGEEYKNNQIGAVEREQARYVQENMRKLRGVVSITDAYLRLLSIAVIALLIFEYIAATFYFYDEVRASLLFSAGIILLYGVIFKIFRYATRSRMTPRIYDLLNLHVGKTDEVPMQEPLFDPPSARIAYAAVWPRYGMRKTIVAAVQTFVIVLFAVDFLRRLWWHTTAMTPAVYFFPDNIYIALGIVTLVGLLDIFSNMLFLLRTEGMKRFAGSVMGMIGLATPISGQVLSKTLKQMAENNREEMRNMLRGILHEHTAFPEVRQNEEYIINELMNAADNDARLGELYSLLNKLIDEAQGVR